MPRVAIIGSGLVGRAWAVAFARGGCEVALWDGDSEAPPKALAYIASILPALEDNGLLAGRSRADILGALRVEETLAAAVEGVNHVQENTPEKLDVKKEVFARLDEVAPADAVLASSTSAILPSAFTEQLAGRQRCLVVHPLNPPYLIPAAEIVPAPWTDSGVMERTRDFLIGCGQAPIVMKRELDGFIMNRMQGALLEEAFRLVADGYATSEDVDIGIREGLALRWSFMGPLETIDLNAPGGVRDYVERYQGIYANLFPQMQRRVDWGGPVLEEIERDRAERVPRAELEQRQRWRDQRLMALAAHKHRAAKDIGE